MSSTTKTGIHMNPGRRLGVLSLRRGRRSSGGVGLLVMAGTLLAACSSESGLEGTRAGLTGSGGISADLAMQTDWGQGYCAQITVKNGHATASTHTWQVGLAIGNAVIYNAWSATFSGSTGSLSATAVSYNATLAPGQSAVIGFCANRPSGNALPQVTSVTSDLPGGGTGGAGGAGGGAGGAGGTCQETGGTGGTGGTKVELQVGQIDDWVYVTVNGVRRKVYHYADAASGVKVDATSWFVNGNNDVRVEGVNDGGPANYDLQIFVNGALTLHDACSSTICDGVTSLPQGIYSDKTLHVSVAGLRSATSVSFSSSTPGKLYLNDVYTGLSTPASLSLSPGSYVVGLGTGDKTATAYYEQSLAVGTCPKQVALGTGAPLPIQSTVKVAILPVRNTWHGDSTDVGVLFDSEIPTMVGQAHSTADTWVTPFSYGLTNWQVDLRPTVETTPLHRAAASDQAPDTNQLLVDAGLTSLMDSYDIIVFFFSTHHADGTTVTHEPCCVWTGGKQMSFSNGYMNLASGTSANVFLLHESLHSMEWFNFNGPFFQYNGVSGLHGAGQHGYVFGGNGEDDFLFFYRMFMRGQVAEVDGMAPSITWPNIPTQADLWIGVFQPFRRGVRDAVPLP